MPETGWVSAHLFYHGDQDAVITGAVRPAAERLRRDGLADGFFYLRYWEGGPHVRLRVRTRPEHVVAVRAVVEHAAEEFFRTSPSRSAQSEQDYAESAPRLAAIERKADYDTTLHPDNSLAFIDYLPENAVFGTGRALEAVERQFTASSALAAEMIGRGRTPGQRAMDAFAMLAANRTVFTSFPPEIVYQSRFMVDRDPESAKLLEAPEFRRYFDANKVHLRATLAAVSAVTRGVPLPDASVAGRWLATIRDLTDTLVELELLDQLDARPAFEAPDYALERINHVVPQWIVERCTHLMCNRLGINLVQESRLRLLLAMTAYDPWAV